MKHTSIGQTSAIRFSLCAIMAWGCVPAKAGAVDFYDWTSTFTGSGYTFTNTSSAGTISGSSPLSAFGPASGTWGMPTAITSQLFTQEFMADGAAALGTSATFNFSSGYAWGTGGELILGNIHNYYQYTLSAWDGLGNPIDINTAWNVGTEYQSTAPGTLGYFSTSTTQESATGNSENFFVDDPGASANGGQGGVLTISGLLNVGEIQLTLTSVSLAPNAESSDLILVNVGTPAPEPAAYGLCLAGFLVMGAGTSLCPSKKVKENECDFNQGSLKLGLSGLLVMAFSAALYAGSIPIAYMAIPGTPANGFTTTLPGYAGTVTVTESSPDSVPFTFQDQGIPNSATTNGAYAWTADPDVLNFYNTTGSQASYTLTFQFNGPPAPAQSNLLLVVAGLATGTTATASQTGGLVGEYHFTSINTSTTDLTSGDIFSSAGDGNALNTGWALFQPTSAVSSNSLSVVVSQQNGDGIGFTLGYVQTAPEPASVVLLGFGLLAVAGVRLRRPRVS